MDENITIAITFEGQPSPQLSVEQLAERTHDKLIELAKQWEKELEKYPLRYDDNASESIENGTSFSEVVPGAPLPPELLCEDAVIASPLAFEEFLKQSSEQATDDVDNTVIEVINPAMSSPSPDEHLGGVEVEQSISQVRISTRMSNLKRAVISEGLSRAKMTDNVELHMKWMKEWKINFGNQVEENRSAKEIILSEFVIANQESEPVRMSPFYTPGTRVLQSRLYNASSPST